MRADDLRDIFLFDGLTDEQISQLMAVGTEVHFDAGETLFTEGEPADFWWVLLDGQVELLRRTGHEVSVVSVMDRPGVWAGGFRAWTDKAGYLSTGRGARPGRMLQIPAAALGDLVRAWSPFAVHLIEGFFQTVRNMEALSRQREALVALGTLAAGLAHELNNPAAAAVRAVEDLQDTCETLLGSLVRLAEGSLPADRFVAIDALRRRARHRAARPPTRWRSPTGKTSSPTGSTGTGSGPPGGSRPRWRRLGPAWTGASARPGSSTAPRWSPAWSGWRALCRPRPCSPR